MIATKIKQISYWNEYARWYRLWRQHNSYHEPIKKVLFDLIPKKIKVLDIGAGDGVLSFPLLEKGFYVTALEPAESMQKYLYERASQYSFRLRIDSRRFEDLEAFDISEYDLALACNSLHLTHEGIEASLSKIFSSGIKYVFFVTEKEFSLDELILLYPEYELFFRHSYLCESSFAYHSLSEAFEHWQFRYGRGLFSWEKEKLLSLLSYEKGHIWLKDFAFVNIFYWRRRR